MPETTTRAVESAPDAIGTGRIVWVVQPDAPTEPIAWPVTRVLVARWFGVPATAAGVIIDGIAGVADARADGDEAATQATEAVTARLIDKQPVSIFSERDGAATGSPADLAAGQIAAAFVAWLLKTYDAKTLQIHLSAIDPERPDQAATDAYHRPLGALEEAWLTQLGNPPSASPLRALLRHMVPLFRPYWLRQIAVFFYRALGLAYTVILPWPPNTSSTRSFRVASGGH